MKPSTIPRIDVRTVVLASATLSLAWASCRHDIDGGGWRGSIDTIPNGAIVVRSDVGAWDAATAWRVVEDLRIGTPEEGQGAFTHVVALEVDALGRMYVLDRDAQEIRVFDSTGAFVRTIGRPGKGPGEFTLANGLGWSPGGQLWVADQRNERFTLFDTAGRVVDTRRRALGFSGWAWEGGTDMSGFLFENQFGRQAQTTQVLLRIDPLSARIDTFPLGWFQAPVIRVTLSNGGYGGGPVPFSPKLVWRVDPRGGLWLGVSDRYRIVKRGLRGDTLLIIEHSSEPVPLERAEIDSAVTAFVTALAGPGGSGRIRSRVEGAAFPRTKPAFNALFLDDTGRVWVLPSVAAGEPRDVLDVFDADGRLLGRVSVPFALAPYRPLLIRRDRIYAVTEDRDGIPYVVRARVIRRPPVL